MNYTTLAKVRAAMGANTVTDDALIQEKITEASRALDRLCSAPDDYFMAEILTGERCDGFADANGTIICFPKKSVIASVSTFAWRLTPLDAWQSVDVDAVEITNLRQVSAYAGVPRQGKCYVRISYSGGVGEEVPATEEIIADPEAVPPVEAVPAAPAVITGLPEDIINAATVLAVRFYKEEKSGLTDAIGVAELGMMQYTKAFPTRVIEMMKPYKRIV